MRESPFWRTTPVFNIAKRTIAISLCVFTAAALTAPRGEAETIKVGIFENSRSIARQVVADALKEQGIETRFINNRDISAGKLYDCDVMYFGGGWSGYNWVDLKGRIHLVEFVQKRGCGVIFSMFRCGSAARSMIRPIFPEVANAYSKANGKAMEVVEKSHPIAAGPMRRDKIMQLPPSFPNPQRNTEAIRTLLDRVKALNHESKRRLRKMLDEELDLPYLDALERECALAFRRVAPDQALMLRGRFVQSLNEQRGFLLSLVYEALNEPETSFKDVTI